MWQFCSRGPNEKSGGANKKKGAGSTKPKSSKTSGGAKQNKGVGSKKKLAIVKKKPAPAKFSGKHSDAHDPGNVLPTTVTALRDKFPGKKAFETMYWKTISIYHSKSLGGWRIKKSGDRNDRTLIDAIQGEPCNARPAPNKAVSPLTYQKPFRIAQAILNTIASTRLPIRCEVCSTFGETFTQRCSVLCPAQCGKVPPRVTMSATCRNDLSGAAWLRRKFKYTDDPNASWLRLVQNCKEMAD